MEARWRQVVRVAVPTVLLSVVAACTAGQSSSPQKVMSVHKVVSTDSASLIVTITDGRLSLVPGSPGQVSLQGTVTYRGSRTPTILWQEGTPGLTLQSICPSGDTDCGYDYTLVVPVSMAVIASNMAGDVSARGLTSPAHLVALAGNVTLADLAGRIDVTATAGDVVATNLDSQVANVTAGAGDVTLRFAVPPSQVSVHNGAGNVTAVLPSSASYHVIIVVGQGVTSNSLGDDPSSQRVISLATGTGNVTVSS